MQSELVLPPSPRATRTWLQPLLATARTPAAAMKIASAAVFSANDMRPEPTRASHTGSGPSLSGKPADSICCIPPGCCSFDRCRFSWRMDSNAGLYCSRVARASPKRAFISAGFSAARNVFNCCGLYCSNCFLAASSLPANSGLSGKIRSEYSLTVSTSSSSLLRNCSSSSGGYCFSTCLACGVWKSEGAV